MLIGNNFVNKLESLKWKCLLINQGKQRNFMNFNKLWFLWEPEDVQLGAISENARNGDCYQCAKFHACIKNCTICLKFRVMPPNYIVHIQTRSISVVGCGKCFYLFHNWNELHISWSTLFDQQSMEIRKSWKAWRKKVNSQESVLSSRGVRCLSGKITGTSWWFLLKFH